MEFEKTSRNTVRRVPDRGQYDRQEVYAILDAGFLCHLGFVVDGQPFVIPTLYGRRHDHLYLHGSAASRLVRVVREGINVCLTVTHVDGIVLARSAFHHSINYRSVVAFGTAAEVEGDEKESGLLCISEQVLPGRWAEVRAPSEQELKATSVLRFDLQTPSAKVRKGPPKDEEEDYTLPIWAGLLPVQLTYGPLQADPKLDASVDEPRSALEFLRDA